MDRFSLIAGLALLAASTGASAFVSPSPPPGFGGAPGSWTFTPPSAAQQIGGLMRGPGPSVAGEATTAAFRAGSGAARALAGRAVAGLIPGVGAALAIAWLASYCFERQGGQWVRTCFADQPPVSDGYEYMAGGLAQPVWRSSREEACADYLAEIKKNFPTRTSTLTRCPTYESGQTIRVDTQNPTDYFTNALVRRTSACPAGWYKTPAGCVQQLQPQPVTPQQVEDEMATKPLPQQLPQGVPYPLDPTLPSVFNPDPVDPSVSRPLRTPQGNPVPIPDTNPQQYRQPVTRWTHSPTAADPWRLDARPEDIVSNSPTGMTGPESVTSGSPQGKTPDKSDLCADHPDILACQKVKLDPIEPDAVKQSTKNLAITPDGGWGPSVAGCPPDRTANVSFGGVTFSYQPFCQFASGIRPIVIAVAWLLAAGAFFGFARRD